MAAPDRRPPVGDGADAPESDPACAGLNVYMVGGAVRDAMLGLPAGDRDWVVVGATPELLEGRGCVPVGGDFPVFHHPVLTEEHAQGKREKRRVGKTCVRRCRYRGMQYNK